MDMDTTSFNVIFQKFYDRIEKDETFFKYHNVDVAEAITIAHQRAKTICWKYWMNCQVLAVFRWTFPIMMMSLRRSTLDYTPRKSNLW